MTHVQLDHHGHDVIITGLPRSGTTLVCHLLNKLPDVFALNEPMDVAALGREPSRADACGRVKEFFAESRRTGLESGVVYSRHVDGAVPDNVVRAETTEGGLRQGEARRGLIAVNKSLSADFLLCIKHPSAFTALLPELGVGFPVFAIVRNPLSVLASWNSVNMSVSRGRVPAAEDLDQALRRDLESIGDVIRRQLHLLDWFFGKYRGLGAASIVRYEDVVTSGGAALASITTAAEGLHEPMRERNASRLYEAEMVRRLGDRLLDAEGAWWDFYMRKDVERLLERY